MTRSRRRTYTRPLAFNVLAVFRAASADDVAEGRAWYASARSVARELADSLDGDIDRAACTLAVLSPLTPWSRNVQLARQAYALARDGAGFDDMVTGPDRLRTIGSHARKAAAIVLGADPWSVVGGPKVTPFARRIVDAGTGNVGPSSVVIDRHAHDVALGAVTDNATRGRNLSRRGSHERFALCYVRAAAVLSRTGEAPGITPSELQAVTWVAWRRTAGHAQARAAHRRDSNGADRAPVVNA